MKLLLAHPTGNQFFRHLAAGLSDHGVLGRVATGVNFAGFLGIFSPLLPSRLRDELERRAFREPWAADLRTHSGRELGRLLAQRAGWSSAYEHETGRFSVDAVYQDFDQWLARCLPRWQKETGLGGVYAYEDGALATFTAARSLGLKCFYDLPIAYWETVQRLMTEEAERLPAWAPTLGGGIADSEAKRERKVRELELADAVICPSQFVVDSLPAWARGSKQIVVAPFGSPVPEDGRQRADDRRQRAPSFAKALEGSSRRGASGEEDSEPRTQNPEPITNNQEPRAKLRVLFVGSMGQRKGLGDLFAAMRLLNRSDVELVVMGSLLAPMEFYRNSLADFTYEPGRPHEQVLELMRSCDLLCLPSIVEGRALVMQEAMSQGLPIIITPNTGGEDLIEDGRTGFLVPIRCPERIAEKIAWCADHRAAVAEMGHAARLKAGAYTWERYSDMIFGAVTRR